MDFSDFFCFRLGAISRKMQRYYNQKLQSYGITIAQCWVLLFLSSNNNSNLKDIATALQLDSPVVTGIIDRLVKEELVTREEDPNDRRSLIINLTSRGSEIVEEVFAVVTEYNGRIKSIVESQEVYSFEKALAALEAELE